MATRAALSRAGVKLVSRSRFQDSVADGTAEFGPPQVGELVLDDDIRFGLEGRKAMQFADFSWKIEPRAGGLFGVASVRTRHGFSSPINVFRLDMRGARLHANHLTLRLKGATARLTAAGASALNHATGGHLRKGLALFTLDVALTRLVRVTGGTATVTFDPGFLQAVHDGSTRLIAYTSCFGIFDSHLVAPDTLQTPVGPGGTLWATTLQTRDQEAIPAASFVLTKGRDPDPCGNPGDTFFFHRYFLSAAIAAPGAEPGSGGLETHAGLIDQGGYGEVADIPDIAATSVPGGAGTMTITATLVAWDRYGVISGFSGFTSPEVAQGARIGRAVLALEVH